MDIGTFVAARGGFMHRSSLRDAGFSPHSVRLAIQAGEIVRAGRDRVAVPGASAELRDVGSLGLRLSCISAAKHAGLWTRNDVKTHVSAPRGYSFRTPNESLIVHWGAVTVPVGRDAAVEPIVNALVHVASCQPLDYAVATFDAALNHRLVSEEHLQQLATVVGGRFAAVVALADGRADAGSESLARVRLGRMGIVMVPQVRVDGHPVDGMIGRRLVIQIDGFEFHGDPRRRARDLEQDRRMLVRGYSVLRFPSADVEHKWDAVERPITQAVALGLHLRSTAGRRRVP